MKIEGHHKITQEAVKEFLAECERELEGWNREQLFRRQVHGHPSGAAATVVLGPAHFAVERDILDVLSLGHWSNFAQKHHFMRRFDGQSPHEAYLEACNWVYTNTLAFADAAAGGRGTSKLQELGNACHAVEDSFARGHAERERASGPMHPGAIVHIKLYAGKEKEGHSHLDTTWSDENLLEGRLAKNAVKALLRLAFQEIHASRRAGRKSVGSLAGWTAYREHWLKASAELSRERDAAYDLVDEFYSGMVWGDTNTALDFDEEGLAKAIYDRLGGETPKVRAVFERLDEYHTADADDVAHYYVNLLRSEQAPQVSKAVGVDANLVDLLIRVLDEGWTTGDEQDCIEYLKTLRS